MLAVLVPRRSTDSGGSFLESLVGGQQFQPLESASGKDERREVNRVEGTKRPGGGHGTRGLTDTARDFPQIASGPDRNHISVSVNESFLRSTAERPEPDECPAGLDQ
jgi:hypothetical protein